MRCYMIVAMKDSGREFTEVTTMLWPTLSCTICATDLMLSVGIGDVSLPRTVTAEQHEPVAAPLLCFVQTRCNSRMDSKQA
jgi:hypothetical protein